MRKSNHLALPALLFLFFCTAAFSQELMVRDLADAVPGNMQTQKYLPLLAKKRVAVVTNASGIIGSSSLVDTLLKLGVKVKKVFVPEHGFRGEADAGVTVPSARDKQTGLPVISLYGKNKKPAPAQLADVDVVLYDIQDLGVRFYTYISTMTYMMEACAENRKTMVILDRPNPNGFYIDGPVLEKEFRSFLGLHPVPVVYGMTCGEYAQMVNGEGWLKNRVKCRLTVIRMEKYDRNATYRLPVKPSPNIPNEKAVLLYPGLGLFEGTVMSVGRGTEFPFQVIGHPGFPDTSFSFTPLPNDINKAPRYAGKKCYGTDLRNDVYVQHHPRRIQLEVLTHTYFSFRLPGFFEENFNYHAGNATLQRQLTETVPETEIRSSWEEPLKKFRAIRSRYLLYDDFGG